VRGVETLTEEPITARHTDQPGPFLALRRGARKRPEHAGGRPDIGSSADGGGSTSTVGLSRASYVGRGSDFSRAWYVGRGSNVPVPRERGRDDSLGSCR
jgi:hypothetical protein